MVNGSLVRCVDVACWWHVVVDKYEDKADSSKRKVN